MTRLLNCLGPNVSTTPIMAMGCQQCLPLSVVQLKGKHCPKPHCCNGVVDTLGKSVISRSGYQALDRQSSELRRLVERYKKAFLFCCFPKCWFFVQWRTSRRNETCADQTRRDVRIIMRTFHSVHGISTYLAQRVTRWDFMKTSCIFSFDSSMSSIGFYLNCTAKLPRYVADQEQQLMVQLNNWQIFPCLRHIDLSSSDLFYSCYCFINSAILTLKSDIFTFCSC